MLLMILLSLCWKKRSFSIKYILFHFTFLHQPEVNDFWLGCGIGQMLQYHPGTNVTAPDTVQALVNYDILLQQNKKHATSSKVI